MRYFAGTVSSMAITTSSATLAAIGLACGIGLLALSGCAESAAHRASRIEPMLAAAGFRMRPADTSAKVDDLKSRTQLKVRYTLHDGRPRYWFADPVVCDCLYVGNEADYQRYEQLRIEQRASQEEAQAAALNEDAVEQEQMNFMMWPIW